jgi:hypothetical protein
LFLFPVSHPCTYAYPRYAPRFVGRPRDLFARVTQFVRPHVSYFSFGREPQFSPLAESVCPRISVNLPAKSFARSFQCVCPPNPSIRHLRVDCLQGVALRCVLVTNSNVKSRSNGTLTVIGLSSIYGYRPGYLFP